MPRPIHSHFKTILLLNFVLLVFGSCASHRSAFDPIKIKKSIPRQYAGQVSYAHSGRMDTIEVAALYSYSDQNPSDFVIYTPKKLMLRKGDSVFLKMSGLEEFFYTSYNERQFDMLEGHYEFYGHLHHFLDSLNLSSFKWRISHVDSITTYHGKKSESLSEQVEIELVNEMIRSVSHTSTYKQYNESVRIDITPFPDPLSIDLSLDNITYTDYYTADLTSLKVADHQLSLEQYIPIGDYSEPIRNVDSGIVLLDYFHMACKPCIEAIPMLGRLQAEFPDVRIISINPIDCNKQIPLLEFIEAFEIEHEVYVAQDSTAKLNSDLVFPTFILYQDGQLVSSWVGFDEHMPARIEQALRMVR